MDKSPGERHKIIYETWLADKSYRNVARQFGMSWQRVHQIVTLYHKRITANQALFSEHDPLQMAVNMGKLPSNILTSLIRDGYGSDFSFDELVVLLRTNTLDQQKFQRFGSKSLSILRELFLTSAEIEELPPPPIVLRSKSGRPPGQSAKKKHFIKLEIDKSS